MNGSGPEFAEDEQLDEEQRIIKETKGLCESHGGPELRVNIKDTPAKLFTRIARGARNEFYNYNAMKWLSCNMQYNFSFIGTLRRWADIESVQTAISNLSLTGEASAEGNVWRAEFKGIENLILLKTARAFSNDAGIFHEFFVGTLFTNELRQWISNFMYVYGLFKCSRPRLREGDLVNAESFCQYSFVSELEDVLTPEDQRRLNAQENFITRMTRLGYGAGVEDLQLGLEMMQLTSDDYLDNPISYLIIENIPGGLTLSKHLRDERPSFQIVVGYLLQLVGALEMALERFDFCHYDLHSSNVVMRRLDMRSGRTFIPLGYGRDVPRQYFVESRYIPTFIDYGRSHVRRFDITTRRIRDYGYQYGQDDGIYPDQSRPIYDLYRLVGAITMDLLHKYNSALLPLQDIVYTRRRTLIGPVHGEVSPLSIARDIVSRITDDDIYNVIRLWSFFPFFVTDHGDALIGSTAEKVGAILFILSEYDRYFNIADKWPEAETYPMKNLIYPRFTAYLQDTFTEEVFKVLFRREDLPEGSDVSVFSCEFNRCQ